MKILYKKWIFSEIYGVEIAMKHAEIVSILCELHNISGFRVSLHGTDFEEIAAYPAERLPFCSAIQKSPREYARCVACDSDACRRVEASGETLIWIEFAGDRKTNTVYSIAYATGRRSEDADPETYIETERQRD